jgi:hypothetical protein
MHTCSDIARVVGDSIHVQNLSLLVHGRERRRVAENVRCGFSGPLRPRHVSLGARPISQSGIRYSGSVGQEAAIFEIAIPLTLRRAAARTMHPADPIATGAPPVSPI